MSLHWNYSKKSKGLQYRTIPFRFLVVTVKYEWRYISITDSQFKHNKKNYFSREKSNNYCKIYCMWLCHKSSSSLNINHIKIGVFLYWLRPTIVVFLDKMEGHNNWKTACNFYIIFHSFLLNVSQYRLSFWNSEWIYDGRL